MRQLLPKIAKLIVETDNNRDVVGDAFISQPEKKIALKLGTIFGIVELLDLPEEFTDNFIEILSDLKTEYYLPPLLVENGVEKRFEECLQRANRRISLLIQDFTDETDLDNINVLIGLAHQQYIFLSQIGKLNAILLHQSKNYQTTIVDILKQSNFSKNQKTDLEKMFSNIISGEITASDSVVLYNNDISEHFSQNELSEIITNHQLIEAVRKIESSLETTKEEENFYLVALQPATDGKFTVPTEETVIPTHTDLQSSTPQESLDKLVDTQKKTEEYLTPSMMPNWQKMLVIIIAGIVKFGKKIFAFISQIGKSAGKKIKTKKQSLPTQAAAKAEIVRDEKVIAEIATEAIEPPTEKEAEAKTETTETTEVEPAEPQPKAETVMAEKSADLFPKTRRRGLGFLRPKAVAESFSRWLNKQIVAFSRLSKPQKTVLIAAFVLVFLFSQSIVVIGRRDTNKQKVNIQAVVDQAEELINMAEARNIFNDEDGAREAIAEAVELLAAITNDRKYITDKDNLQNRIDKLNNTLQKITYLTEPTVIANLDNTNSEANTVGLVKIGNIIYTLDNQNHSLYAINLEQKQTTTLTLSEEIGRIIKLAAVDETKVILLNDQNEFWQYSFDGNVIEKALSAGSRVVDFDIYANKIYTLQPDKNQIYKHLATSVGFNTGSAWIQDGSEVKNATTMTIDGGVYTADNTGTISYLLKGERETVNFTVIEPPLESPIQIYSHIDSNYLYVLDANNQRVIIFNKAGDLEIQYNSKEFKEMKSILVAEDEKTIYLLSENKIYQLDIAF